MPVIARNITVYAFLFIIIVTAFASLAANLGFFGEAIMHSPFAKWSIGAVLGEIVAAYIIVWKSGIMKQTTVSGIIRFQDFDNPYDITLDPNECYYEIRDAKSKIKSKNKVMVVWARGGWECKIPAPKDQFDSVIITLTDRLGDKWEIRPFYPMSKELSAVKL